MPIDIQIREDLSLAQLQAAQRAGKPVFKSPHAGNFYGNNLAVARLGIPMIVFDNNKGELDKNFHPHCVIEGGRRTEVTCGKTMMTHAVVHKKPHAHEHRFEIGQNVSRTHMQAIRDAIPNADIVLGSDRLKQEAERVIPMLEVAAGVNQQMWHRYVESDGRTRTHRVTGGWEQIRDECVYGIIGTNCHGWHIPNPLYIVVDAVLDAVLMGADEVYHLSGPDMYRYITKLLPTINELYDAIRRQLDLDLPEALPYHLVPVSQMRFAVPQSRRAHLNELVDAWLSCEGMNRRSGEIMRAVGGKQSAGYNEAVAEISIMRRGAGERLKLAMQECPWVLYNIDHGDYWSQYDLLTTGEEVYVHPWGVETPIAQVNAAAKKMLKMHRGRDHGNYR